MSRCELCGGRGFIIKKDEKTKEDVADPCECFFKRGDADTEKRNLTASYIPDKYFDYTIETYLSLLATIQSSSIREANDPQVKKLKKIIDDPINEFIKEYDVLWIWGRDANSGHTSLAVMLAKSLIKKGYKVRYLRMQDLLTAFTSFEEKNEYFHNLKQYNVYLIDDALDTTRCIAPKEYTRIHFYNWISSSLDAKKNFICTSKVHVDKVDSVFDQIKHLFTRSCLALEFQGSFKKVV